MKSFRQERLYWATATSHFRIKKKYADRYVKRPDRRKCVTSLSCLTLTLLIALMTTSERTTSDNGHNMESLTSWPSVAWNAWRFHISRVQINVFDMIGFLDAEDKALRSSIAPVNFCPTTRRYNRKYRIHPLFMAVCELRVFRIK
jgi:hypothetical protein